MGSVWRLKKTMRATVDATGVDYIRRVRNGVQRMGQLIDALLQLSRITRAEINREECGRNGDGEAWWRGIWSRRIRSGDRRSRLRKG